MSHRKSANEYIQRKYDEMEYSDFLVWCTEQIAYYSDSAHPCRMHTYTEEVLCQIMLFTAPDMKGFPCYVATNDEITWRTQ